MFAITNERLFGVSSRSLYPPHSVDITLHEDMSEHDIPEFMECKLEEGITCIEIATVV